MGLFDNVNVQVDGCQDYASTLKTYGTIVLKPNIVDNRNILTQAMLSKKNTKYVIRWDYEIEGEIEVPENCLIEFDGGTFNNGTLKGNNTVIISYFDEEEVLINVTKTGTWKRGNDIENRVNDLEDEVEVLDGKVGTNETDIASLKAVAGNRTPSAVVPEHKGKITLLPNPQEVNLSMTWRYFINTNDGLKYLVYVNEGMAYLVYNADYNEAVIITSLGFDTYNPQDMQDIIEVIGENYLPNFDLGSGIMVPGGTEYSIEDLNQLLSNGKITQYRGLTDRINLLTQEAFTDINTIYIIQDDFSLNGSSVTIPNNCTLEFKGGSFNNGRITLNSAKVLPYYNDLVGVNLTVYDVPAAGTLYKRDTRPFLSIHDGTSWVDVSGFTPTAQTASIRPSNLTFPRDCGFSFFDRNLNKPIWALTTDTWIECDGVAASTKRHGSTDNRPTTSTLYSGFVYFDESLDRLIVWNGNTWLEQDGAQAGAYRAGDIEHRPAAVDIYIGYLYYDTEINSVIVWTGEKWIEPDGATAGVLRSGTTSQRPSSNDIYVGFRYYATNLVQFIIWNGQTWVYECNGYTAINDGAVNNLKGLIASKPYGLTSNDTGFEYYATDEHKKITFEYSSGGSKWYYADGTEVTE